MSHKEVEDGERMLTPKQKAFADEYLKNGGTMIYSTCTLNKEERLKNAIDMYKIKENKSQIF